MNYRSREIATTVSGREGVVAEAVKRYGGIMRKSKRRKYR